MKNFKQLKIWQRGVEIASHAFLLVKDFPVEERFSLARQITRSAVSIPSNIAEGNSRKSTKDKQRFMELALGSAFELESHLVIAEHLSFGKPDIRIQLLAEIDEEQKMIMSFISVLDE